MVDTCVYDLWFAGLFNEQRQTYMYIMLALFHISKLTEEIRVSCIKLNVDRLLV